LYIPSRLWGPFDRSTGSIEFCIVSIMIGVVAFLLGAVFRWSLARAVVSLVPAECILLYMIVSYSAGTYLPLTALWWEFLYSHYATSTYLWLFGLNMFLALPWVIGTCLAFGFRQIWKKTASQDG
jgi:hypothetical protein